MPEAPILILLPLGRICGRRCCRAGRMATRGFSGSVLHDARSWLRGVPATVRSFSLAEITPRPERLAIADWSCLASIAPPRMPAPIHCAHGDPRGNRLARTAGRDADRTGRLGGKTEPDRHDSRAPRLTRSRRWTRRAERTTWPRLRTGSPVGSVRQRRLRPGSIRWSLKRRRTFPLRNGASCESLVKDTDGFMARHVERPISLQISRRLARTAITPNQMSSDFNCCWGMRRAIFSVRAAIAANNRGAHVSCAFDPGWVRRRTGQAEIPGIAMGRRSRFLGRQCRSYRYFWLHGAGLEPVRRRGLAVVARRRGGFRHVGIRRLRLLAAVCASRTTGGALFTSVSAAPERGRRGCSMPASRRDFIYLAPLLALIGKANWFLLLPIGVGRRHIFCWLCFSPRASGFWRCTEAIPRLSMANERRRRRLTAGRRRSAERTTPPRPGYPCRRPSPPPESRRPPRRTSRDGAILPIGTGGQDQRRSCVGSEDNSVVSSTDVASFAIDLDMLERSSAVQVRKMWLVPEVSLQGKRRRVFERPLVKAARFEPRGDAAGNASPAHDAIERMPAVIEQDAAARHRRINAPVCAPSAPTRSLAEFATSASGRIGQRRSRRRRSTPKS